MKILMIGNTASTGWNFKKGLEKQGHKVTLVFNDNKYLEGKPDYSLEWNTFLKKRFDDGYDIVHVHEPNYKKYLAVYNYLNDKNVYLVCHWHGSDLRLWGKCFPFKKYFFKKAVRHIISNPDLSWWLRDYRYKTCYIVDPVDTDMFYPNVSRQKKREICFNNNNKLDIKHSDMPDFINQFRCATVIPSMGLSPYLMSVTALECLSCGLQVKHHHGKDRNWVLNNASISIATEKLMEVYDWIMDLKN